MQALTELEKREYLQTLLIELSQTQDVLQDSKTREEYFSRLESIYHNIGNDNFRHYYSDIFSCLTLIDGDDSLGNLEILTDNIRIIKENYIPSNKDENNELIDISKEINKLYDHINLDIGRINYNKEMNNKTISELARVDGLMSSLEEQITNAKDIATKSINEETEKLKNEIREGQMHMQNEYITILGIFAAIVIAFTGGMTFATSVLESVNSASPYRLLTIVLVIGLILINLIGMLLDYIRDINGINNHKNWIIITNVIIILGLIINLIAYQSKWLDYNDSMHLKQYHEGTTSLEVAPASDSNE